MAQSPVKTDEEIAREAVRDFRDGKLTTAAGEPIANTEQAIATALLEAREQASAKSGHRGGGGTAHAEGRSGSEGAGHSGSPGQRNTNR